MYLSGERPAMTEVAEMPWSALWLRCATSVRVTASTGAEEWHVCMCHVFSDWVQPHTLCSRVLPAQRKNAPPHVIFVPTTQKASCTSPHRTSSQPLRFTHQPCELKQPSRCPASQMSRTPLVAQAQQTHPYLHTEQDMCSDMGVAGLSHAWRMVSDSA